MAWFFLFIAGIMEIVWAIGIKYTESFTRLWWSVGTISAMVVSFFFLSKALETIPVGTGYAVWTGIGAVGTAILGMILFNESREMLRLLFIGFIIVGIIGLKFVSTN